MKYEVTLQAVCVVLVEAASEEQALEVAWDESRNHFQVMDARAQLLTDEDAISRSHRHADLVLELDQ